MAFDARLVRLLQAGHCLATRARGAAPRQLGGRGQRRRGAVFRVSPRLGRRGGIGRASIAARRSLRGSCQPMRATSSMSRWRAATTRTAAVKGDGERRRSSHPRPFGRACTRPMTGTRAFWRRAAEGCAAPTPSKLRGSITDGAIAAGRGRPARHRLRRDRLTARGRPLASDAARGSRGSRRAHRRLRTRPSGNRSPRHVQGNRGAAQRPGVCRAGRRGARNHLRASATSSGCTTPWARWPTCRVVHAR